MSVLAIMVVPAGILMGADRNITVRLRRDGGRGVPIEQIGQEARHPKVFEWPNGRAVIGHFGLARVGDFPMHRWLYRFMGRHLAPASLREVAEALRDDLNAYVPSDDAGNEPLVVHIAGFDKIDGELAPVVWFVRNATLHEHGYYTATGAFICSEELRASPPPDRFQGLSADAIRMDLSRRADRWEPFWFKQGSDLAVMNTLEAHLWAAMRTIVHHHPRQPHPVPQSLEEWEKHLRLAILTFGAYFEAFARPYERLVGGGADIVTVPWPDTTTPACGDRCDLLEMRRADP